MSKSAGDNVIIQYELCMSMASQLQCMTHTGCRKAIVSQGLVRAFIVHLSFMIIRLSFLIINERNNDTLHIFQI